MSQLAATSPARPLPPRPTPATLLCEACGYEIEGLEDQTKCPECGRDLAESDPRRRRTGSPWQQAFARSPGIRRAVSLIPAAALTMASVILHPPRLMRRVRIAPHGLRLLTLINTTIAASILTAPTHAPIREFVFDLWPSSVASPASLLGPTLRPAFTAATFALWLSLLLSLTLIERLGVQFFSRRRGWRISPTVALAITAHASFLWIFTAVLAVLAPTLVSWLADHLPLGLARYLIGVKVIAGPLGFIGGMTWFELTTFLGVRASRYANEPRD